MTRKEIEDKIEELQDSLNYIEVNKNDYETEMDKLEADLLKIVAIEEKIESLTDKFDDIDSKLTELQSEINDLESKCEELEELENANASLMPDYESEIDAFDPDISFVDNWINDPMVNDFDKVLMLQKLKQYCKEKGILTTYKQRVK